MYSFIHSFINLMDIFRTQKIGKVLYWILGYRDGSCQKGTQSFWRSLLTQLKCHERSYRGAIGTVCKTGELYFCTSSFRPILISLSFFFLPMAKLNGLSLPDSRNLPGTPERWKTLASFLWSRSGQAYIQGRKWAHGWGQTGLLIASHLGGTLPIATLPRAGEGLQRVDERDKLLWQNLTILAKPVSRTFR